MTWRKLIARLRVRSKSLLHCLFMFSMLINMLRFLQADFPYTPSNFFPKHVLCEGGKVVKLDAQGNRLSIRNVAFFQGFLSLKK